MDAQQLKERLDNCPVLTEVPDSKAQEALERVLTDEGFFILYGLLLGTRQTHFAALSQAPLGSMAECSRAAVIQGRIQGIEFLYSTAIEVVSPKGDSTGAEEQR